MQNYVRRVESCEESLSLSTTLHLISPSLKMGDGKRNWILKLIKTVIIVAILAFGIPISTSYVLGISILKTISLIIATFTLEYLAAAVGIGLGLDPIFTLFVTTCVALSVVLLLITIFDVLGEKSKKVSDFLSKAREKAQKTKVLQKYGVYGLVLAVPILGFYICPAIAWILGWRKDLSISMIITGFVLTSSIILSIGTGILKLISYFH